MSMERRHPTIDCKYLGNRPTNCLDEFSNNVLIPFLDILKQRLLKMEPHSLRNTKQLTERKRTTKRRQFFLPCRLACLHFMLMQT